MVRPGGCPQTTGLPSPATLAAGIVCDPGREPGDVSLLLSDCLSASAKIRSVEERSCQREIRPSLTYALPVVLAGIGGTAAALPGFYCSAYSCSGLFAPCARPAANGAPVEAVLGAFPPGRALVEGIIGLVLLVAAGRLIVIGATGIAAAYGASDFVIGATVVAVGTSVPELASTIISRLRGHNVVGLGSILGSNIFSGLFTIGVASSIAPTWIGFGDVVPALTLGMVAVALTYPSRSGVIDRRRGSMLLAVYAVYLVTILQGLSM
jgi:cation:H+ antiporter